MKLIARICADHRLVGWCLVSILGIAPLLGFLGYRIAEPSEDGWVPQEVLQKIEEAEATFRFGAGLVLVLECDDFFQPRRIQAMQTAAAGLREMDEVHNLVWMGDVVSANLRGRQTPLLPTVDDSTSLESLQDAGRKLIEHPISAQSLISAKGTTALMLIDAREREHVATVRAKAIDYLQGVGIKTRVTGSQALYEVHDRALGEDHIRIQLMAYLLVGVMAVIIFRRPMAIIVAGSGPVVGVIWTLGWLQLLGQSGNELAKIILPVMIIMIGYTDGVHLVVRIRQMRAAGESARDSVYHAVLQIGPACFLTSITTAIGFGSLMLSNSEVIAGFGRVSAIGVVVTFLSVVLVIPLLANSWMGSHMHVTATHDPLSRLMNRCAGIVDFSSRHAKAVTIFGVVLTISCLYACSNLIPDDSLGDRVPHSSEPWQAMTFCDDEMDGVRYLRFVVRWSEQHTRKELWPFIRKCEELLEQEELIGPTTSVRTALTVFNVPNAKDRSVLVNQLPDEFRDQFYRGDLRCTQIVGRLQDLGIARLSPMFANIEEQVRQLEQQNPGFEVELFSDVILEGQVVQQMIEELIESLVMASAIIFLVLAIAFRSLRIGLISIIPNLMPLAASGAIRLMISESLDIASACSFAICLGIAVDDTIHYLSHFRHERAQGRSPDEANRRTFVAVGSALMMTTIVMIVGLGTVMTSSLPPHVNFAAMGCTTLAVALPADLLFLPALLSLFPGKSSDDTVPEDDDKAAMNVVE